MDSKKNCPVCGTKIPFMVKATCSPSTGIECSNCQSILKIRLNEQAFPILILAVLIVSGYYKADLDKIIGAWTSLLYLILVLVSGYFWSKSKMHVHWKNPNWTKKNTDLSNT
ncbi:hypothetical protein QWY77_09165 [Thalassotalea ponticola]|uniref:hypothetical protein n=1 Tax=Thalassotalea ponticola TaxID=1523392 RepID=UPI0025B30D05|nr:hypothetical protein [Thalassotalea ponticola]MDN3652927.1 hypothetical protein [Thalassotalea ponticola]